MQRIPDISMATLDVAKPTRTRDAPHANDSQHSIRNSTPGASCERTAANPTIVLKHHKCSYARLGFTAVASRSGSAASVYAVLIIVVGIISAFYIRDGGIHAVARTGENDQAPVAAALCPRSGATAALREARPWS